MVAVGATIFSGGPLCGTHHWSKRNSSGLPIAIHDPRSSSIFDETGNITVIWNDAAAAHTPGGGTVCYFVTTDSVTGVRLYQASGQLSLAAGLVNSASVTPDLVPLIGPGEPLPQSIFDIINGTTLNAGVTDIRPEDAKFATMRALTPYGTQVTGRSATGVGYGPFPIGTGIRSSQGSGVFFPVDFAIDQGDVDPINPGTPIRKYVEIAVGAAPVMVFANVTNTNDGHLGDGLAASPPNWRYSNINRFVLANILTGTQFHIRDIAASGVTFGASNPPTAGYGDVGIHTFIREPLSGTYNTMEW